MSQSPQSLEQGHDGRTIGDHVHQTGVASSQNRVDSTAQASPSSQLLSTGSSSSSNNNSNTSSSGGGWFSSLISKAKSAMAGSTAPASQVTSSRPAASSLSQSKALASAGVHDSDASRESSTDDGFVDIDARDASLAAANGRQRPQQVQQEAHQLRLYEQELIAELNDLCANELNCTDILGLLPDAPRPLRKQHPFPDPGRSGIPPLCTFSMPELEVGIASSTTRPRLIDGSQLIESFTNAADVQTLTIVNPSVTILDPTSHSQDAFSAHTTFHPELLSSFAPQVTSGAQQHQQAEPPQATLIHSAPPLNSIDARALKYFGMELSPPLKPPRFDPSFATGSLEADHVLWCLQAVARSILSPQGAHLTPDIFIPSHFWLLPNFKIAAHTTKLKSLGMIAQTLRQLKAEFTSIEASFPTCIEFFRVNPVLTNDATKAVASTKAQTSQGPIRWLDMLTVCSRLATLLSETDQQLMALRKSLAFEILVIPKATSASRTPMSSTPQADSSAMSPRIVGSYSGSSPNALDASRFSLGSPVPNDELGSHIPYPGTSITKEDVPVITQSGSDETSQPPPAPAQPGRFTPYINVEEWEQVLLMRTQARAQTASQRIVLPPPSIFTYLLPETSLLPQRPSEMKDAILAEARGSVPEWAPTLMSTVVRASASSLAVRQATQQAQMEQQAKKAGGFFGRVKAMAYSAVQEASRVGKNALPSRLNPEESIVYMRALVEACMAAQELRTLYRDIGHIVSPPAFIAQPRCIDNVYVDAETAAALWTAQAANRAVDSEAIIAAMNRQKQLQRAIVGIKTDESPKVSESVDQPQETFVAEAKSSSAHRQMLEQAAQTRLAKLSEHLPGIAFDDIKERCLIPELELNEENVADAHSVHCLAQEIRFRLDRITLFLKETLLAFVLDDLRRNAEGFLELQETALHGE